MYSKEEAQQQRKEFWTSFGLYMKKHHSLFGPKVRWINYRTGIRDLFFRVDATSKEVYFSIDIQHKDEGIRELFYEQFTELKVVMEEALPGTLEWCPNFHLDSIDKSICRIIERKENVSIYNKNDWKEMFEFMEGKLVAMDAFWFDFKDIFIQLDN